MSADFRWLHILVMTLLLPAATLAADMRAIGRDNIEMRSGPGRQHQVVWQLDAGFPVEVLKAQGEWLQVRDFEGSTGWVEKKNTQQAAYVIVRANKGSDQQINLRQQPDTSGTVVATARYGVVFKLLEKKGGWVKVQHGQGVTGWVDSRLLWGL